MFTLVSARDDTQIFAWGIEIIEETRTEAVIYRRDPQTNQAIFGVHPDAEAAKDRFSRLFAPMAVCWEEDYDELNEPSPPDDLVEAAGPAHPQP